MSDTTVSERPKARISTVPQEKLDARLVPLFERLLQKPGYINNSNWVLAHRPDVLLGIRSFADSIEVAPLLSKRLRHLINARVAQLVGCPYCLDMNAAESREQGIGDDALAELTTYWNSSLYTDEEKLVLTVADAMTQEPVDMPADVFEKVRAHFGDEALVELASRVALANVRSRMNAFFHLEPHGLYACVLPIKGGGYGHNPAH